MKRTRDDNARVTLNRTQGSFSTINNVAMTRRERSAASKRRFPQWGKRTIAALVPAALIAVAIVQPGFPVESVELNDGSVWLTNSTAMKVGRYNAAIEELTNGLVAGSSGFDVLQDGDDVAVVTPTGIEVVDPAEVTAGTPAAIPASSTATMANGVVSVTGEDGSTWIRRVDDVEALRTDLDAPDMQLGTGGASVVAPDGTVLGVSTEKGTIYRGTVDDSGASIDDDGALPRAVKTIDSIAAVGTDVFVLSGGTLLWDGGEMNLSDYGSGLVLQQSGKQSDTVLVASKLALLKVVPGGDVEVIDSSSTGNPAAPVYLDGCAHAAWASNVSNYLVQCGEQESQVKSLQQMSSTSQLVFRVNRSVIVLNDTIDGRLWMPAKDDQVREPNWDSIEPEEEKEKNDDETEVDENLQIECTESSDSPTATDDEYGIRAGRSLILPVIDNDSASDCGALAINAVDGISPQFGTVEKVYDGRALQLTAAANATGATSFTYTISDGRKNSATATATVTVRIVGENENRPPKAQRQGSLLIEQGAQGTYNVLPDFFDPDGDDMVLRSASSASGLTIRSTADGRVTVVATGETGKKTVDLVVSDGREETTAQMTVDVRAPRTVIPIVDPVMVNATVDQEVTVKPLDSVRSVSLESPALAAVADQAGTNIAIDQEQGTFTFKASTPKTYYVDFIVVAGTQQASGVARIDVKSNTGEPQTPVAVKDSAFLPTDSEIVVDPLVNDFDPAGGVLVLTEIDVPQESGLKIAVLDHHYLQISATRQLDEPVSIPYTMVASGQSATGEVRVIPVEPTAGQPPIVEDINVTVRTGGVVTIPVLDYASDADGDELTLLRELPEPIGEDEGLLFVSGDNLRFQASETPGVVNATFTVSDEQGNETSATAVIRVHESAMANKQPPTPHNLTARTFEGQSVRISVPLTGIDVDGDGVSLLGIDEAPIKGRITEVGADYLIYEALPGEQGTDSFTYAVEDWVGLRQTARIDVGIAPFPAGASQVVARDDELTVRPGEKLEARVLRNDVDLAGGELDLVGDPVVSEDSVNVSYENRRVVLTAPDEATALQVGYEAANKRGGRDSATLHITVDPDAPFQAPIARDVVVPPTDTVNKQSVDVDVLAVAENPSGPLSDLAVSIDSRFGSVAKANSNNTITVQLQAEARTIPYLLTNTRPEADGLSSYAFVTVPALGDFSPTLRPGTDEVTVPTGEQVTISLAEYVQVGPGKAPILTLSTKVEATKSDGTSLVKDDETLLFRSQTGYSGPASITFEVTDGKSADDPDGRVKSLTLPITVTGGEAAAPQFNPATFEVAPGESPAQVDLREFTTVMGSYDPSGLKFSLASPVPAGFSVELKGAQLSVSAATNAKRGKLGQIDVDVQYRNSTVTRGTLRFEVVASQRRLVSLGSIPDQVANEGKPISVSVLNNALNPFPGEPLKLTGATVSPSEAGTVTVSGGAVTVKPRSKYIGSMVVTYRVNDVLADPTREVTGTFTVTVRGRPDTPAAPTIVSVGNGRANLSWTAPANNGASIDQYRVSWSGGSQICTSTSCTITGLTNGRDYSFRVEAHNEVGWSDPSAPSRSQLVDVSPGQVTGVVVTPGDGSLNIRWNKPPSEGSAVNKYTVTISGGSLDIRETSSTSIGIGGLRNGTNYLVTVQAHNRSEVPGAPSSAVSGTPVGVPGTPRVEVVRAGSGANAHFVASWSAVDGNGDTPRYRLVVTTGGSVVYRSSETTSTSATFKGGEDGVQYGFQVEATNRAGTSKSSVVTALMWTRPSPPTSVTAIPGSNTDAANRGSMSVNWTPGATGGLSNTFEVYVRGGSVDRKVNASNTSATISNLPAGSYTVSVRACNGQQGTEACSQLTQAAGAVNVLTRPGTPQIQSVTAIDGGASIRATWQLSDTGNQAITRYRYRVKTSPNTDPAWTTIPANSTFVETTVTGSGTFELVAVNAGGNSATASKAFTAAGARVGGAAHDFGGNDSGDNVLIAVAAKECVTIQGVLRL